MVRVVGLALAILYAAIIGWAFISQPERYGFPDGAGATA
jgi:hypothetical protein